jgi:hypothetical protein
VREGGGGIRSDGTQPQGIAAPGGSCKRTRLHSASCVFFKGFGLRMISNII